LGFKVTSKDADTSEFRKSFNWIAPFLMYYLLAAVSIGFGLMQMWDAYESRDIQNMISIGVSFF